jgi:hypothetical protein
MFDSRELMNGALARRATRDIVFGDADEVVLVEKAFLSGCRRQRLRYICLDTHHRSPDRHLRRNTSRQIFAESVNRMDVDTGERHIRKHDMQALRRQIVAYGEMLSSFNAATRIASPLSTSNTPSTGIAVPCANSTGYARPFSRYRTFE